jgi:hypothetical protein
MTFKKWLRATDHSLTPLTRDPTWPKIWRLGALRRHAAGDPIASVIEDAWSAYRNCHHPERSEVHRGNLIHFEYGQDFICSTGEPCDSLKLPCVACGQPPTVEGYDACIGMIPDARAACCGHGSRMCCYVVFIDQVVLRHGYALHFFRSIGRNPSPFMVSHYWKCDKQ